MEENHTYRDFLEMLKIELGDFLRLCETGRTIRHASLKARKKSIRLRQLLKDFRQISLGNDRRIESIIREAKNKIKESNI
jgi:hypothetical protein